MDLNLKLLPVYFLVGGTVVTAITYFGARGNSFLAAFVAMLPSVSVVTLITVYLEGGRAPTVSYAVDLIKLLPPWLLYIGLVVFLIPRLGLWAALGIGVVAYAALAYLIWRLW